MKIVLTKKIMYIKPDRCCVCGTRNVNRFNSDTYWYPDHYDLKLILQILIPSIQWDEWAYNREKFYICSKCYKKLLVRQDSATMNKVLCKLRLRLDFSQYSMDNALRKLTDYNFVLVHFIVDNYPLKVVT